MVSVERRVDAGDSDFARSATSLEASKPRSDLGTIFLHWVVVIAALVSLLTGLRIAADATGAVIAPLLEPILPNGEVWTFHVFAGLTLFFCMAAYAVYIYRAALGKRNSPKRVKALTLPAPKRVRWAAANVALHWLAYAIIVLLTGTGVALYLGYGGWIVPVHRMCALTMLAYIFLHTIAHFMYGGVAQLLRLFRAAPLARNEFTRTFPLLISLVFGVAAAAALAASDHFSRATLVALVTPHQPVLDGRLDDAAWQVADVSEIMTQQGENTAGFMQSRVEVRAAYDAENIYFAFRWSDPTRSLMRVPIRKEADGWYVVGTRVAAADVNDYYEDKLAVLFTDRPAFGGGGTTFMGRKPLPDKPGAANLRGLHYTVDGRIFDLWQWKAARGGMLGYVDDMFVGPPIEPNPRQVAGTERYSAGYLPDPGKSTYIYNYKAREPNRYDQPVDVLRLPTDLAATLAAMGEVPGDPDGSVQDGSVWWLTNETSAPYTKELDDRIPVGTMIPAVLNINEYEGDRADIRGGAHYEDGHWTLETVRKRTTGSKYDQAFEPGSTVYVYISVFDHTQTRHTRHQRPMILELE